jgi:HAD superfamily hydrolase (TIGR01509 family)
MMGAIFDWDGVVVDSSAHHEASWEKLAQETGLLLPENHFKRGFGMKNEWILPNLLNWTHDLAEIHRLSLRKEELYREIIRERGIEPLPGVRDLLDLLHEKGVPAVIGSSTHRLNITTTLDSLRLGHRFAAICSAEDVTMGKPAPQVFLLAAQKINRPPAGCVVFEDAQVGIDAALAGGMKAVGVATTHPLGTLRGPHRQVHRLTEVDWAFLNSLWAENRERE